jgi:hypothetical protein
MAATKVHTLPEVTSPQTASEEGCFLKTQKTVLRDTEHLGEGNVTMLWWNLFNGGKTNYILRFDVVMALCLRIGTSGM